MRNKISKAIKINKMMNLLKIEKLITNTNRVETFNNKMIEKEDIIIIKKTIIRIENIIRRIKIKSTMNPKIHNINKNINLNNRNSQNTLKKFLKSLWKLKHKLKNLKKRQLFQHQYYFKYFNLKVK